VRGIVLAGGGGSRLFPATKSVSKQLLAVYDKPMIYYPVWSLVTAGIREILIISTPRDLPAIQALLGDGSQLGLELSYEPQANPGGIAEAFLIGKSFIGGEAVTLILGDNIFIGDNMNALISTTIETFSSGAHIYLKPVPDPKRFGIAEIGINGSITSLHEKPEVPRSNLAVTGIYTYDEQVVGIAERLERSPRNELEITDVNQAYLEQNTLQHSVLPSEEIWIDAGTPDSLVVATVAVQQASLSSTGTFGSVEVAAFLHGYLGSNELVAIANSYPNGPYRAMLLKVAAGTSS
jgi:glucose-1-phosphate thymidylyltransferase